MMALVVVGKMGSSSISPIFIRYEPRIDSGNITSWVTAPDGTRTRMRRFLFRIARRRGRWSVVVLVAGWKAIVVSWLGTCIFAAASNEMVLSGSWTKSWSSIVGKFKCHFRVRWKRGTVLLSGRPIWECARVFRRNYVPSNFPECIQLA